MKKHIKYIIISFVMFFSFNNYVKAEPMRVCRYQSSSVSGTQYYDAILITESGMQAYRTSESNLDFMLAHLTDYYDQKLELRFSVDEFMPNWKDESVKCPPVYTSWVDINMGPFEVGQYLTLSSIGHYKLDDVTQDKVIDSGNIVLQPDDIPIHKDPPGGGPSMFDGECPTNAGITSLINALYTILKIATPIALIIFGLIDFAKAVASSDEGKMKKAQSAFIRRVMAAIVVFLVMAILTLLSRLIPSESGVFSCVRDILK